MQMGAAKLETSGHSIDTATGQNAPAELSSDRVKKIFTDIAWDYERFNRLSSFGQYISWLETLIDKSPITPETQLLDIAGGTGDVSFMACNRKKPAKIVLSDYTPAMLDVAKERLEEGENRGVPVELAVVDGQDIPYEDESFDIITMSYGIRNMPKREQALSEMYRVLKPGGACSNSPPLPIRSCALGIGSICASASRCGERSARAMHPGSSILPNPSRLFRIRKALRRCCVMRASPISNGRT